MEERNLDLHLSLAEALGESQAGEIDSRASFKRLSTILGLVDWAPHFSSSSVRQASKARTACLCSLLFAFSL